MSKLKLQGVKKSQMNPVAPSIDFCYGINPLSNKAILKTLFRLNVSHSLVQTLYDLPTCCSYIKKQELNVLHQLQAGSSFQAHGAHTFSSII